MKYVGENVSNFKYLTALEAAGSKCNRLGEIIEAYKELTDSVPKLHGRIKSISARIARARV